MPPEPPPPRGPAPRPLKAGAAEAITGEVAWLKEAIYGGRNVKPEFEVRDALLRYSKRPGKKVVKEV
ncbi:MAG: hypothetical protein IPI89_09725 [Propionivibrio sp.]|nr:hypothetical protein [Propionivibrio sp.]